MRDTLERIADALERIADALEPQEPQEAPLDVHDGPTLTNPLLAWFVAREAPQGAEEAPLAFADLEPSSSAPVIVGATIVQRGRPANRVSHCGRCGREDTRRMNHSDSCRECVNEPWWTE
jgi:hypothetical protein